MTCTRCGNPIDAKKGYFRTLAELHRSAIPEVLEELRAEYESMRS